MTTKATSLKLYNTPDADNLHLEHQSTNAGIVKSYSITNDTETPLWNEASGPRLGTKVTMLAISGNNPVAFSYYINDTATPNNNKMCIWNGQTWQVMGETIQMIADGALEEGWAVEISNSGNYLVKATTNGNDKDVMGVVAFQDVADSGYVTVAYSGIYPVAVKSDNYNEGEYIKTSSNTGLGEAPGGNKKGVYCRAVKAENISTDGDLLQCFVHPTEMD